MTIERQLEVTASAILEAIQFTEKSPHTAHYRQLGFVSAHFALQQLVQVGRQRLLVDCVGQLVAEYYDELETVDRQCRAADLDEAALRVPAPSRLLVALILDKSDLGRAENRSPWVGVWEDALEDSDRAANADDLVLCEVQALFAWQLRARGKALQRKLRAGRYCSIGIGLMHRLIVVARSAAAEQKADQAERQGAARWVIHDGQAGPPTTVLPFGRGIVRFNERTDLAGSRVVAEWQSADKIDVHGNRELVGHDFGAEESMAHPTSSQTIWWFANIDLLE